MKGTEMGEDTKETPREVVREFAEAMEKQLQHNNREGNWDDMPQTLLLARLLKKVADLAMAIEMRLEYGSGWSDVEKEAAEVASFAMMVWDSASRAYRKREKTDA